MLNCLRGRIASGLHGDLLRRRRKEEGNLGYGMFTAIVQPGSSSFPLHSSVGWLVGWLVGWCALSRPLVRRKTDRKRTSSLRKFNLRIHCHKKPERERRRCESGRSELAIWGIGFFNKLGWKVESEYV